MPRNTPVKYYRWIAQAPDDADDQVSYDGNPVIALGACVALIGFVCSVVIWAARALLG